MPLLPYAVISRTLVLSNSLTTITPNETDKPLMMYVIKNTEETQYKSFLPTKLSFHIFCVKHVSKQQLVSGQGLQKSDITGYDSTENGMSKTNLLH